MRKNSFSNLCFVIFVNLYPFSTWCILIVNLYFWISYKFKYRAWWNQIFVKNSPMFKTIQLSTVSTCLSFKVCFTVSFSSSHQALVALKLFGNQIVTLPPPIKWKCSQLRTLDLSKNQLGKYVHIHTHILVWVSCYKKTVF